MLSDSTALATSMMCYNGPLKIEKEQCLVAMVTTGHKLEYPSLFSPG